MQVGMQGSQTQRGPACTTTESCSEPMAGWMRPLLV